MPKKKSPKRKAAPKSRKDICFAIMPFGGWLDGYYSTIYKPAVEAAGLEVHRADDLFRPSTIVHDIWSYTKRAKLLLADLTGKNPNVFYELGLAHALAKPAILVAETMDDIPFDLRALRIIIYDKNVPEWGELLRESVTASIKEILVAPIQSVLPAFLDVTPTNSAPQVTSHEKEILEIRQDLDLLRREIRSGRIQQSISISDQPSRGPDALISTKSIGPEEAQAMIKDFLNSRISDQDIITILTSYNVPRNWASKEINRQKTLGARKKRRKLNRQIPK